MRFFFGPQTLAVAVTAALLAGCGGAISPAPLGATAPSTAAQLRSGAGAAMAHSFQVHANAARSWMAPDAKKANTLLYVADEGANVVDVYSYPGGKLKGTLTGFETPTGVCSDKKGNVYILNGASESLEVYAHGASSPTEQLEVPGYPEFTCSVDPTTGNLALSVLAGSCGYCIVIFPKGSQTPTTYMPSGQTGLPGCGYDNKGNLYCSAYGASDAFALYELPKGSKTVGTISVNASGILAGPGQWDGTNFTVGSGAGSTLYQIKISGSSGSVAGSTILSGAGQVWQFWITKNLGGKKHKGLRVIGPTTTSNSGIVGYWSYPAGGAATNTIVGLDQPDGAALSTKK
ncbi:MAG TPA: hypothetical protein VHX17_10100 [Candidatus Cybelea sp.]|nr:hypothetical protein [Candidatus Cybelea sp.]